MSRELFEIVQGMGIKNAETQLAMQCAPLITGLKISNLLIIQNENVDSVKEILKNTDIAYCILCVKEEKTIFLLYKESKLESFLSKKGARALMGEMGYGKCGLTDLLTTFQKRYEFYINGGGGFPHEMGLFLCYPLEDVYGFIENQGKNFLYTGYWKVYDKLPAKIKLFRKFEQARESLISLLYNGVSIMDAIGIYSENKLLKV